MDAAGGRRPFRRDQHGDAGEGEELAVDSGYGSRNGAVAVSGADQE
jgi:hypothetical protein